MLAKCNKLSTVCTYSALIVTTAEKGVHICVHDIKPSRLLIFLLDSTTVTHHNNNHDSKDFTLHTVWRIHSTNLCAWPVEHEAGCTTENASNPIAGHTLGSFLSFPWVRRRAEEAAPHPPTPARPGATVPQPPPACPARPIPCDRPRCNAPGDIADVGSPPPRPPPTPTPNIHATTIKAALGSERYGDKCGPRNAHNTSRAVRRGTHRPAGPWMGPRSRPSPTAPPSPWSRSVSRVKRPGPRFEVDNRERPTTSPAGRSSRPASARFTSPLCKKRARRAPAAVFLLLRRRRRRRRSPRPANRRAAATASSPLGTAARPPRPRPPPCARRQVGSGTHGPRPPPSRGGPPLPVLPIKHGDSFCSCWAIKRV